MTSQKRQRDDEWEGGDVSDHIEDKKRDQSDGFEECLTHEDHQQQRPLPPPQQQRQSDLEVTEGSVKSGGMSSEWKEDDRDAKDGNISGDISRKKPGDVKMLVDDGGSAKKGPQVDSTGGWNDFDIDLGEIKRTPLTIETSKSEFNHVGRTALSRNANRRSAEFLHLPSEQPAERFQTPRDYGSTAKLVNVHDDHTRYVSGRYDHESAEMKKIMREVMVEVEELNSRLTEVRGMIGNILTGTRHTITTLEHNVDKLCVHMNNQLMENQAGFRLAADSMGVTIKNLARELSAVASKQDQLMQVQKHQTPRYHSGDRFLNAVEGPGLCGWMCRLGLLSIILPIIIFPIIYVLMKK
jgi:hypothetical protein